MQKPSQIVDMHTHLFNARYLPLRGIAISRGIPKPLADIFARLSWALTHLSEFDSNAGELPDLLDTYWQFGGADSNLFTAAPKSNVQSHFNDNHEHSDPETIDQYITILALNSASLYYFSTQSERANGWVSTNFQPDARATNHELFRNEIQDLFQDIHTHFGDDESARELETPRSSTKMRAWGWGLVNLIKRVYSKILTKVDDAIDFIDFAWNMTRPEERLLDRLSEYYTKKNIPFILVHHMMDMEYPYRLLNKRPKNGEVKISYYKNAPNHPSQLSQMRQLALKSQGTLLGFSAFDPTRFLDTQYSKAEIEAHLDSSISYGMIGFKFYPPLGFRPAQNSDPRTEEVVDIFLDYCASRDICVFAHCTPKGFELSPKRETGQNAAPKYWRAALEKPGRNNLRLCLGHAGGGLYHSKHTDFVSYGWLARNAQQWDHSDNYAAEVVSLCREYTNVYCELANIDTIISDSSARKYMAMNLKQQLTNLDIPSPYLLKDKIMYGTDWHMVGMVNDLVTYSDKLLEIFNQPSLLPNIEPFFNGNALKYLKNQDAFAHNAFNAFRERLNDKVYF